MIELTFLTDNFGQFTLPNLVEDGIKIGSLAKLSLDPSLEDQLDQKPGEITTYTKVMKFGI